MDTTGILIGSRMVRVEDRVIPIRPKIETKQSGNNANEDPSTGLRFSNTSDLGNSPITMNTCHNCVGILINAGTGFKEVTQRLCSHPSCRSRWLETAPLGARLRVHYHSSSRLTQRWHRASNFHRYVACSAYRSDPCTHLRSWLQSSGLQTISSSTQ